MAADEVSQRALEISRKRQQTADEEQRRRDARQLEIDWQIERARERLEDTRKHFLEFWSKSTRHEVVWGPQTADVDEQDRSTDHRTEIPSVSISTAIQFWQRQDGQPALVEIGVLSVSNSSLLNGLEAKVFDPEDDIDFDSGGDDDSFDWDEGIGPIFHERVPPRGFVYAFSTANGWRSALSELNEHNEFGVISVAQFAEAVGRIAIDVIALSVSSGNSPLAHSAATAEIRQAKQNAVVRDWFLSALIFVLKWGLVFAAIMFFSFVIAPPLKAWLRAQGIGGH